MKGSIFPGGLTLLMAVYAGEQPTLLRRAVKSVYENTIEPDSFILVVDGPIPDLLEEVVSELSSRPSVRIVRLPRNIGLAAALNVGLEAITTTWIARADSDDRNLPHRFETQAAALADANWDIDVLGGAILEVDDVGTPLGLRAGPVSESEIRRFAKWRNPFNHMTIVFRAAAVRAAGGYPAVHLKEDYALWIKMIAAGCRLANLPDVIVHAHTGTEMYRRRGGLRYVRSEYKIQKLLVASRLSSRGGAVVRLIMRSLVFLLPNQFRAWFYIRFLRRSASDLGSNVPLKYHSEDGPPEGLR